jgi:hypothetical protein
MTSKLCADFEYHLAKVRLAAEKKGNIVLSDMCCTDGFPVMTTKRSNSTASTLPADAMTEKVSWKRMMLLHIFRQNLEQTMVAKGANCCVYRRWIVL